MKKIFLGLLGTFFGLCSAYAQSTTSLRGVVTDPSGGVIPDAIITLMNTENGGARHTITHINGAYSFPQIAPGNYELVAEKSGFAKMTRTDVTLLVNLPSTLDLAMIVRDAGEVVNVHADVSQINTTDASMGNGFSELQVRQVPLQTRNVVELLSVQPV